MILFDSSLFLDIFLLFPILTLLFNIVMNTVIFKILNLSHLFYLQF